jgi:hypothetical protein
MVRDTVTAADVCGLAANPCVPRGRVAAATQESTKSWRAVAGPFRMQGMGSCSMRSARLPAVPRRRGHSAAIRVRLVLLAVHVDADVLVDLYGHRP